MRKIFVRFMALLLAQCGLAAFGSTTLSVTVTTDGTGAGTLRGAINQANNDATPSHFPYIIQVNPGTYNLTLGELDIGARVGTGLGSNVVITGTSTYNFIIIHQNGSDHVFCVDPNGDGHSTFAFANLTIENGSDTGTTSLVPGSGGGGINAGDGGSGGDKVMVTNCAFMNNTSQGTTGQGVGGAAISSDGGSLVLNGCSFTGNTMNGAKSASLLGGAVSFIAADAGDTLTASACTFENNSLSGSVSQPGVGGAVATLSGGFNPTANFTNCVFSQNSVAAGTGSAWGGGALSLTTNSVNNIIGCEFVANHISGSGTTGGAIQAQAGSTNLIKYCSFVNNYIASSGVSNDLALVNFVTTRGILNANDNWWLSDNGPLPNAISGTVSPNAPAPVNWLFLTNTASASPIFVGQTSTLTASFLHDSAGNAIASGNLYGLIGLPVSFTGTDGSISSAQTTIQSSGTATAIFTGTTPGSGSGSATVDGVTSSASIQVNAVAGPTTITLESVNFTSATLQVTGTPTVTYHVLASDDLISWATIGSVLIPSGGSTNFIDGNVSLHTNRFYQSTYP